MDCQASTSPVGTKRKNPPRWTPHPKIAKLRASGWTMDEIAETIGSTWREVYRWAAGDTRPLGVYERALAGLRVKRRAA